MIRQLLRVVAWIAISATSAPAADAPVRPNIVVFIADDLSVKDSSAYGNTDIPGPNMLALAKEGLTFDRAYVASPSCAPSRAALLTGQYGVRSGAMFNHQAPRTDVKRWPAYFQTLGYEVAAIGKVAHYAQVKQYGFDYAASFNYHEDDCVEKAVTWLAERESDKPLCLFVGTNWPHVPWPQQSTFKSGDMVLPARNADTPRTRQARTKYATAVTFADRDLGRVREATRKYLPADTLFVFTADHGSQFPFAKWNLYEAGVRTPLIAVWPGHVAAGRRTKAMVSWIDLLPTLLDAANADANAAAPDIDGRSFLPVLAGKSAEHRDRVFATHSGDGNMNYYPSRALRLGDLKYLRNLDPALEFHTHVDKAQADTGYFGSWINRAKTDPAVAAILEQYYHRPAEELYDLTADPDELKNLAADPAHAEDLNKVRAAMDEWMKSQHDDGIATDRSLRSTPATRPAASRDDG